MRLTTITSMIDGTEITKTTSVGEDEATFST